MTRYDARGCAVSGATRAALDAHEFAGGALLAWRDGVDAPLAWTLQGSPAS